MFKNPGKIIKDYVQFLFWLLVVVVAVVGVLCILSDSILYGICIIVFGVLSAYVFCLLLYAFGDLVESNAETKANTEELLNILETLVDETEA